MIDFLKKGGPSTLSLLVFLLLFSHPAFSKTTQPNLRILAQSAVLMDALSGQVLYEQNPQVKIPPASFAKILTLYLAFDRLHDGHLKMDNQVVVSRNAWRVGGSKMFLKAGEKVNVEDLIKGVAIVSGNDACVALAEYLSGSENVFVEKMNEKAKLLGLRDSHFKNAHGMPVTGQYVTALDMAMLANHYIKDHPEALLFHSTPEFEHNGIRQPNRNLLLASETGVDGLITGYVGKSGYHLLATAKREGQRMIAVVMGCDKLQRRYRGAQALLEYGFRNFSTVEAVKEGTLIGPQRVTRGKVRQIQLLIAENGWTTVSKGKEDTISITKDAPPYLVAPVKKGQVVGKLLIQSEGRVLKEMDLLSSSDVAVGFPFFWLLIAGGLLGLLLMGLVAFLRIRRSHRKRFSS
jgi:D-alanyl-D-alanine carboxypeptidase (penicillin-binding protein 5/6)